MLNNYVAFYGGRELEVVAHTLAEAKRLAAEQFRLPPARVWKVAVVLAAKNGKPVTHIADF